MWFRKDTSSQSRNVNGTDNKDELGTSGRPRHLAVDDGPARARETQTALTAGRLPGRVLERMKQERAAELPWTSDLSVSEWHLLRPYGFRPLGLVMGSSYYHIGFTAQNRAGMWMSGDVIDVERAMLDVRKLALSRMAMEAEALGAHAVVGVRLELKEPDYGTHEVEFTAFGTAVTLDGEPPVSTSPVLCTVDGASLVKLLRAGSLPVGLAMGVCVYYQSSSRQDMWQVRSWVNQEIPTFTDAVYQTRNRAVRNMWREASALGASGVLAHETKLSVRDVEVERGQGDERLDHVVEFFTMGTAVQSTVVPAKFAPKLTLDAGR